MDITVRKNYNRHDKITKKSLRSYFWLACYFLFLLLFIFTYIFLMDENLRVFGSLAYKDIVRKISLGGFFTCIILILRSLAVRMIVKRLKAPAYYNLLRVLKLTSILLIAGSIISTFFVNWYAAAIS